MRAVRMSCAGFVSLLGRELALAKGGVSGLKGC